MRFERHSGAPDLQSAFSALVLHGLGGRSLDDNHAEESAKGKFPDFACFRDIVLIEMKHLETDQHERINQVLDAKVDPEEKPFFFGTRDGRFIDQLSNGPSISAAIADKLAATIETVLRKANKQFCDYRSRHPRKNSVSICVVLNSTLREYSPQIVVHAIHRKMKTNDPAAPRFPDIDAILYISEKHFQVLQDGRPAYPVAIYYGAGVVNDADSDDCGRAIRLNAATRSDRRRPPVPRRAAGVPLPA